MSKLIIEGPTKLQGTIKVSGSKNHALPMLAAMLLTTEDVILHNVPDIADVEEMMEHGVYGFLVGESFMRAADPGAKLQELFFNG